MAELASFTYVCGCPASEVGQAFRDGVLVCPVHLEPMAPYTHPERPVRTTVEIRLVLESSLAETSERWVTALEETLTRDETVREFDLTVAVTP